MTSKKVTAPKSGSPFLIILSAAQVQNGTAIRKVPKARTFFELLVKNHVSGAGHDAYVVDAARRLVGDGDVNDCWCG